MEPWTFWLHSGTREMCLPLYSVHRSGAGVRTAGWLSLLHCARGSPSREFLCTAALPGTHLFYKRLQSDVTALLARPRRRRGAYIYNKNKCIVHKPSKCSCFVRTAGATCIVAWVCVPPAAASGTSAHMHADNRQPCLLWLPAGPRCAALTDRPLCCQPALQLSRCESAGQADPVRSRAPGVRPLVLNSIYFQCTMRFSQQLFTITCISKHSIKINFLQICFSHVSNLNIQKVAL